MAKSYIISVGINRYDYLQPLSFAKQDAYAFSKSLTSELSHNGSEPGCKVFYFSDDSPDIQGESTRPSRSNLMRITRQISAHSSFNAADTFWFFFSGHGIRHNERDYIIPCDGDPEDIPNTAIPINYITENLRGSGAGNIFLVLDACRNQGARSGEGIGKSTQITSRQTGIVSIFSCSPNEFSYEISELQQGSFTYSLLKGLSSEGKCSTVEQLDRYLSEHIPKINSAHKIPKQTPYIIAEPIAKSHLIILPQYSNLQDIQQLKVDAYKAFVFKDLSLAETLWLKINEASLGRDGDAIRALIEIANLKPEKLTHKGDSFSRVHTTFPSLDKEEKENLVLQNEDAALAHESLERRQKQKEEEEAEADYYENLKKLQDGYKRATRELSSLDESTKAKLRRFGKSLSINQQDIDQVERETVIVFEAKQAEYNSRLDEFSQEVLSISSCEWPLGRESKARLKKLENDLKIKNNDADRIKSNIFEGKRRQSQADLQAYGEKISASLKDGINIGSKIKEEDLISHQGVLSVNTDLQGSSFLPNRFRHIFLLALLITSAIFSVTLATVQGEPDFRKSFEEIQ